MSDDDITVLVDKVKTMWMDLMEKLRPIMEAIVDVCRRVCSLMWQLVAAKARADWYEAQSVARLLSRHPDLADLDGWLDRMYPDPVTV